MAFVKGGLKIQNERYRPKVTPPDAAKILQTMTDGMDRIFGMKLARGQIIQEKGNRFIGFTTVCNKHETINEAYVKLKLDFPDAQHIVCAYSIPGTEPYYCDDYCNDGEHGHGAALLRIIQRAKIQCRAIFVVRYSGSEKLGTPRFALYHLAAQAAVHTDTWNKFTETHQKICEYYERKDRNTTVPKTNHYVSGGPYWGSSNIGG